MTRCFDHKRRHIPPPPPHHYFRLLQARERLRQYADSRRFLVMKRWPTQSSEKGNG